MAVEGWGQKKEAEAWWSKGWRVRLGGWGWGSDWGGLASGEAEIRRAQVCEPRVWFFGPIPLPLVPGKASQEGGSEVRSLPRPEVWALLGKLGT